MLRLKSFRVLPLSSQASHASANPHPKRSIAAISFVRASSLLTVDIL